MKKRSLNSLKLNKKSISILSGNKIKGGRSNYCSVDGNGCTRETGKPACEPI